MARPFKRKQVGCCMENQRFGPYGCHNEELLELPIDMFETIRLIDYDGLDQTETAVRMNVARSTVQKLYKDARIMIAKSFIENKTLILKGGHYHMSECCHHEHQHHGSMSTKLLIPLEKNQVSNNIVDAGSFLLVTIEEGRLIRKDKIVPEGTEKKGCRRFVLSLGVTTIIVSGMKTNIYKRYHEAGVHVFYGNGAYEEVLNHYVDNKLESIRSYLEESDCCQGENPQNCDCDDENCKCDDGNCNCDDQNCCE